MRYREGAEPFGFLNEICLKKQSGTLFILIQGMRTK